MVWFPYSCRAIVRSQGSKAVFWHRKLIIRTLRYTTVVALVLPDAQSSPCTRGTMSCYRIQTSHDDEAGGNRRRLQYLVSMSSGDTTSEALACRAAVLKHMSRIQKALV
jgi:hypothetical protein